MDYRLQEALRRYSAGDESALVEIYAHHLRSGDIPVQYFEILSLVGDPYAPQIAPKTLRRGQGRPAEIHRLLAEPCDTGSGRRVLYDFYLDALEKVQTFSVPAWYPGSEEYLRIWGPSNLEILDYFRGLGPNNEPMRNDLLDIMDVIQKTFPDREELLKEGVDIPGCDGLIELDIFSIALKFAYSQQAAEGETVEDAIKNIGWDLHQPDFAITWKFDFGFCISENYYKTLGLSWADYFKTMGILNNLNQTPTPKNLLVNFTQQWFRDLILNW